MCGIAGFVSREPVKDARQRLRRMTDAIAHRGPDSEGMVLLSGADGTQIAIGHRRLAIIDLAGGVQPLIDPESGLVLSYNGEIYNFVALRDELRALGHRFQTACDTEVVLRAYKQWGTASFARFRGMFALALWDPFRQRLILARDAFGKKPLFYSQCHGRLLFGSEPKAILPFLPETPPLNLNAVSAFLEWRYVPAPQTLFAGILKVLPGCWAEWDGTSFIQERYYTPPYGRSAAHAVLADPVGEFLGQLDESVALRMQSDVPFGAFLSGGIDSSAIVALMSRHTREKVRTFSVGFAEAGYSELQYARAVAEHFATNHTELVVSADDVMVHLPRLVIAGDGPVSEPSNIPIWLLARKASESVKMVLTGEGADELLAGYPKHSAERFGEVWRRFLPEKLRRDVIWPTLNGLPFHYRRIKTFVASMNIDAPEERLPRWMGTLTPAERRKFMAVEAEYAPPEGPLFNRPAGRSTLERALLFDQSSWLPDNLLERGDRMTMAASIEARMPFLDTELAAFAGGLTDAWRLRETTGKYVLRRAMRGILPDNILTRPKVGFRVPIAEWFRGPMREYLRDHLTGCRSLTCSLYVKPEVERIIGEHESGRANHEKLLWSLLNLETFQRTYSLR